MRRATERRPAARGCVAPPATGWAAWERPALASGLAFAVLQFGAFAYFGSTLGAAMPPVEASHDRQAAFYAAYWDTLALANYLLLVPTPFFLVFLGELSATLRRHLHVVAFDGEEWQRLIVPDLHRLHSACRVRLRERPAPRHGDLARR